MSLLRFTGHPIADVGVATVAAFSGKTDPTQVTQEDLEAVAAYIEKEYFSGKLVSYLTCVFPNSAYVNPTTGKAKVDAYKREVLYGFRQGAPSSAFQCVFSGEPASGLVYRQHVPLLTGEDVLNFFPGGTGGLPVSAPFLLAIQAFPLGALRCLGRALAVHCPDDPALTLAFASRFLSHNRKLLQLAEPSGEKYPDAKHPRTRVVDTLVEIESERKEHADRGAVPGITVFHLTNSGQGPDIDVFELPSSVARFLALVSRAGFRDTWRRMTGAAWETASTESAPEGRRGGRRKKASLADKARAPDAGPKLRQAAASRNYLYEDLFDLPMAAGRFIRTYFFRQARRFARDGDPRSAYSVSREKDLVSWEVTSLFLREVLGMEKNRRETIRLLGDRIADHVVTRTDKRLFQSLYRADRYYVLRNLLIKASAERVRSGTAPLLGLDEFLLVFEEAEETARIDWALARDLVLIRVIEELHRRDWFGKQPETLNELVSEDETGDVVSAS